MSSWPGTTGRRRRRLGVGAAGAGGGESTSRYGHRVGGVGLEVQRRGVVRQQQQAPRPMASRPATRSARMRRSQFSRALHLLVDVAGVARLVGGLDVDDEEVGAVGEGVEGGVPLALVVGVVLAGGAGTSTTSHVGEHAEAPHQVDGGDHAGGHAVGARRKEGSWGWWPWPHSHTWLAVEVEAPRTARERFHHLDAASPPGPGGPDDRLVATGRGAGRTRRRPRLGGHHDVAVLHAGVELDLTPPSAASRAAMTSAASSVGGVAAGEVDHRAVGADGDEVAAEGDLVRGEAQPEGGGLDGRPARCGAAAGVVAEDRQLPTSLPGACPGGSPRPGPRLPRRGEARRGGRSAASSGVRPSRRSIGSSAQPSGTHTTYFTRAILPFWPMSRSPWPPIGRQNEARSRGRGRGPWRGRRRGRWGRPRSARVGPPARPGAGRSTVPVAASTAAPNLAGWAVARQTSGRSGSGAGPPHHQPTAVCGSTTIPACRSHATMAARSGVVHPRRPSKHARAPRRGVSRPNWARPSDRKVWSSSVVAAASRPWSSKMRRSRFATPGCPCSG